MRISKGWQAFNMLRSGGSDADTRPVAVLPRLTHRHRLSAAEMILEMALETLRQSTGEA